MNEAISSAESLLSMPNNNINNNNPIVADLLNNTNQNSTFTNTIYQFYIQALCHTIEALEHILFVFILYAILSLIVYRLIFQKWLAKRFRTLTNVRFPNNCKRVLIVTAHPDDESMFFGPTILSLTKRNACNVYLLCLSNGNHDRLGHQRQNELWKACKILNVPDENITLFKAALLPDDPTATWKSQIIAKQILKQVHTLDIDTLITFDRDGISHHPNHCAIFYSSISIYVANLLQEGCRLFTLDSVNLCRKYTSFFDLVMSMFVAQNWFIVDWRDFCRIRKAMCAHQSQMTWFRYLYIIFSRYMIINTLREIQLSDAELEIQIASLQKT